MVDSFLSSVFHDARQAHGLLFGCQVERLGVVGGVWEENEAIDGYDHGDDTINNEYPA
jgi:hypothetical protein